MEIREEIKEEQGWEVCSGMKIDVPGEVFCTNGGRGPVGISQLGSGSRAKN